jgi:ectoine hydroxylase-related dioxygenase (phytanoyl-CoA dioxygenase family)
MAKADPQNLREVRERGFTSVPGVLPTADIPELRRLLQGCIDDDQQRWAGTPYPDAWMVQNLMARDVKFARVMENPQLQAYVCDLLGDTCIVYAYTSSSMPPGGTNYSYRIHVDCPRVIPGYITNVGVILALDDFTVDNGATYFLPGSFNRTSPPDRNDFFRGAETVTPKAGDMVVFNARTWHLGGANRTDRPRHALTLNACRSYMRQRFDYPRLVPEEIVNQLTEVGRRFLGFNVRMPTSLDDYYVPEEQRLYKSNQG